MELIENIINIMKIKEITPYKMEKDIGIKQSTFVSWKKGSQPPADKILKIIQYLKVSPNELYGYDQITKITENDKELINLFHKLPEREQLKFIGKLEDKVADNKHIEKSLDTRTG